MIYFVIYEPESGRITGRIKSSDSEILKHYDYAIVINEEEYRSQPEVYKKVDIKNKKLIDSN